MDDLGHGQVKLIEGKLKAWIHETTRVRLPNVRSSDALETLANVEVNIGQLDEQLAGNREGEDETRTDGCIIQTAEGELVFEYGNGVEDTECAEELEEPEIVSQE